ncbi:hypothetical protein [Nocardioides rubriscoriae]|nr:hypothetical protein [Nocardioides rubriscoriae]
MSAAAPATSSRVRFFFAPFAPFAPAAGYAAGYAAYGGAWGTLSDW